MGTVLLKRKRLGVMLLGTEEGREQTLIIVKYTPTSTQINENISLHSSFIKVIE